MDIIEPIDPIEPDDPATESFHSSLTGQQIENVLVGIRSVIGVIKRNGENDYSAASASDFGGVEEAPNDGQQYARKNKAWAVVQGGGGGTSDVAWLPNVDASGDISWTRSSSTTAPTTRNIKGPQGNTGPTGPQGQQGAAGISPAVTVSTITGGHRVTITDADHPAGQSFDVMDGSGGGGTASPWAGKNVLILGDSGSDAATYHNNWWQKLSSELGFNTPTVKAYPGYGITAIVENCTTSDVTGKDLIIIEAGANDRGTSLGKVGDLYPAQSTICGKVKYAIETIYTLLANANNLKCRVMFFAPYCFGADQDGHDGYYYDISGLSQAMEDTANYDGLPCYNAYKESGINSHTWSVYMASAADHVHLNLSGNALIGKSISQFIRDRVLPYE